MIRSQHTPSQPENQHETPFQNQPENDDHQVSHSFLCRLDFDVLRGSVNDALVLSVNQTRAVNVPKVVPTAITVPEESVEPDDLSANLIEIDMTSTYKPTPERDA